jgi:hypothetical protein
MLLNFFGTVKVRKRLSCTVLVSKGDSLCLVLIDCIGNVCKVTACKIGSSLVSTDISLIVPFLFILIIAYRSFTILFYLGKQNILNPSWFKGSLFLLWFLIFYLINIGVVFLRAQTCRNHYHRNLILVG